MRKRKKCLPCLSHCYSGLPAQTTADLERWVWSCAAPVSYGSPFAATCLSTPRTSFPPVSIPSQTHTPILLGHRVLGHRDL